MYDDACLTGTSDYYNVCFFLFLFLFITVLEDVHRYRSRLISHQTGRGRDLLVVCKWIL